MKTTVVALLIAGLLAGFAIWKMTAVDDVEVRLGEHIQVRAHAWTGLLGHGRSQEVVTIGPFVSSLSSGALAEIRDRVNECHPKSVDDVYAYSHQNPGAGGEYAVLVLCVPSPDPSRAVTFEAYEKTAVHLDLHANEQHLRQHPDQIVFILAYQGGSNSVAWLERTGSNLLNATPLPPKVTTKAP